MLNYPRAKSFLVFCLFVYLFSLKLVVVEIASCSSLSVLPFFHRSQIFAGQIKYK